MYLFPILLLLFGCSNDDNNKKGAQLSPAAREQAQQLMNAAVAEDFPGLSLTVMSGNDQYTLVAGKADLDGNAMAVSNLHYMQSISKSFTAAAILKLYENGSIGLDQKMNIYLAPEICNNITNGNSITVRHLLTMTSGIADYLENEDFVNDALTGPLPMSSSQILSYVYNKPAHFAPGTSARYSNINYHLLALVIDKVTGRNHNQYITNEIVMPAGLSNTYYLPGSALNTAPQGTVSCYFKNDNDFIPVTDLQFGITRSLIGDDGIVAATQDIALFYKKLFDRKIVSAASLAFMKNPLPLNGQPYYGMGMSYYSTPGGIAGIGHSGSGAGAAAEAYCFESKGITVVLATNVGTLLDEATAEKFAHLYNSICRKVVDGQH